jgi:hypothetical protein
MVRVSRQIGIISLHCTLVEIGPKRPFAATQQSVAFAGKADID